MVSSPASLSHSPLVPPEITTQINYMHSNPCLRAFWKSQLRQEPNQHLGSLKVNKTGARRAEQVPGKERLPQAKKVALPPQSNGETKVWLM